MKVEPANIQYLDTLRAFATLGVITIHVTTPVLKMMYGGNMEYWWIGNSIDSTVRFVIAMFLMLSGATMLGKEYKLSEFYKKRMMRVLVPFLFWLVVYWIYRWSILTPKIQPKEFHSIIQWAINLFVNEGVSKHFWYIYMILVLYLFVPFLGKFIRKLHNSTVLIVLLGWILLNILFSHQIIQTSNWTYILLKTKDYFLYSGYLVVGYYLRNISFQTKKYRLLNIEIFLLTVIFSASATYFSSKNLHKLDMSFYGSLTLNTMFQSVALFLLVKDSTINNRISRRVINTISDYSYGIYLVHIMIISILYNHGIFWTMAYPLVSLPAIIILTLICSYMIIFVLRKIPKGKYISG
jgi:surface polysaccharide O-acyltransferase-like enzyme